MKYVPVVIALSLCSQPLLGQQPRLLREAQDKQMGVERRGNTVAPRPPRIEDCVPVRVLWQEDFDPYLCDPVFVSVCDGTPADCYGHHFRSLFQAKTFRFEANVRDTYWLDNRARAKTLHRYGQSYKVEQRQVYEQRGRRGHTGTLLYTLAQRPGRREVISCYAPLGQQALCEDYMIRIFLNGMPRSVRQKKRLRYLTPTEPTPRPRQAAEHPAEKPQLGDDMQSLGQGLGF